MSRLEVRLDGWLDVARVAAVVPRGTNAPVRWVLRSASSGASAATTRAIAATVPASGCSVDDVWCRLPER